MANSKTATCEKCNGECWTDPDRNYRDFEDGDYEGAEPGSPCNPGRYSWLDAEEQLGIDSHALLCASCLNEVHTVAWKIRNGEDDDDEASEEDAA